MSRYASRHRTIESTRYGMQTSFQPSPKAYPSRREAQPQVEKYLIQAGIAFKRHNGGFQLNCLFCSDQASSMLMSETGRYRCMACNANGNSLAALVAATTGIDHLAALRSLQMKGLV